MWERKWFLLLLHCCHIIIIFSREVQTHITHLTGAGFLSPVFIWRRLGGLGQSWTKFGGLGGTGLGNTNPSWRGFTGEQHTGRLTASDGEDEDGDDIQESHLYRTSPSPTHANLFTSAAMATGGRGLRSGLASRNPGSGDRSWRRDEPAWTERREAGKDAWMLSISINVWMNRALTCMCFCLMAHYKVMLALVLKLLQTWTYFNVSISVAGNCW